MLQEDFGELMTAGKNLLLNKDAEPVGSPAERT
jgi:hypothetical protein